MAKKMELSPRGKVIVAVAGVIQIAFAFLAFRDLSQRDPEEIRGSKKTWVPVILVNWVGPASYFLFGIRRR